MGHAHLAHVVQVGAKSDGRDLTLVAAELLRHRRRIGGHPLAVPEGVAVGRFDRLAPFPHHRHIGVLEPANLGRHVHQVHPRVQPAEEPVRRAQEAERLLVPAHHLVEPGQLARGLRLAQHRPGAHRLVDGGAETRLGQRVAAGLAVDDAEHLVDIGLVDPGVQPVEDGERRLRVAARLLEPLPGDVHLGVIQQAEPLEVDVADAAG